MVKKFISGGQGGGGGFGGAAGGFAAVGAAGGFLGRRVSQSSPAQALGALSQQRGEERQTRLMNKAPSFLRGGKTYERNIPTWKTTPDKPPKG